MKYGIMFANTAASRRDDAITLARTAEAAGYDSLWVVEHVVVPSGYDSRYPYSGSGRMAGGAEDFDIPDPLVWLAVVAGATTTIRLATGILILPQRNPLILAKEVATLDVLSGGRVILGIGVGWLEEEYAALGLPFARRGERAEEYVRALRRLWTEPAAVSFHGSFVSFAEVYSRPLPVQQPVPIVIGGHSPRAARRAGQIGDGFFPASAARERLPSLVEAARRAAERAGRDPAALEITMGAPPVASEIEALREVDVDRVVFPAYLGTEFLADFATELGIGD